MAIAAGGIGSDPAGLGGRGLGLRNMRERVEALEERLEVRCTNGKGTEVSADVPLQVEGAS